MWFWLLLDDLLVRAAATVFGVLMPTGQLEDRDL